MVAGGLLLPIPGLNTQVKEVPAGTTAVLKCSSNDDDHNFMFWQLGQDKIIGPGNDYDDSKYKYEVLSGKLLINSVTPEETGYYRCVSKHVDRGNLNIGAVEMIVKQYGQSQSIQAPELVESSDMEIIKVICIIISFLILIACAVVFYRFRKEEKRYNARLVMLAEDDDDDGSGDEIYNRTTTAINESAPKPGPSKLPTEHITGIDNAGLDTDFNSVFEQISINAASRNLI